MSLAVQSSITQSFHYGGYNTIVNRGATDYEKDFMGAATSRTTSSDKGENIGIMTIGNRGFIAKESFFKIPQAYHQGLNCENIIAGLMRWSEMEYGGMNGRTIDEYSDKEWDRLLKKTDTQIDEMKESLAEEEKAIKNKNGIDYSEKTELLTAYYTEYHDSNSYVDPDSKAREIVKTGYSDRTFVLSSGIVCERTGYNSKVGDMTDDMKWNVAFNDDEDYEKAVAFINRIPDGDNTIFTTREQFWQDFIDGVIDEDEFFEYYDTLDHGVANFIKTDESGKSYIDREMMNSKYFKYFGLQQVSTFPEEDLQRELEMSALRDRGYDHQKDNKESIVSIYDALRDAFYTDDVHEYQFYGESETYSIDDWIREIIRRSHIGLADALFV